MWSSGEEEEVSCVFCEIAAKLEAFGVVGFVGEDLSGELVSFINDDEIPIMCNSFLCESLTACESVEFRDAEGGLRVFGEEVEVHEEFAC